MLLLMRVTPIVHSILQFCLLGAGMVTCGMAAPLLPLRVVESTHLNIDHDLDELVDGDMQPGNGLDMDRGQFEVQTMIFAAKEKVSAQVFQFTTWHHSPEVHAYPAEVEVSVTSDVKPSAKGNWTVLKPDSAVVEDFAMVSNAVTLTPEAVKLTAGLPGYSLTIRAANPVTGVTGFRLRFLLVDAGHVSGQKVIGRSDSGNCVLNEFQVEPDPLRSSNVALGKTVVTPGPVFAGLSPAYVTDGFPATFSHPADDHPAKGFFFEVDLGATRKLDHVVVRSRMDRVSPERLSNYEIQLFEDDGKGKPGKIAWTARLHDDGSYVPAGGKDVMLADDGKGTAFAGRFVRIVNPLDQPSRPQVGELEVYPRLSPRIATVEVDGHAVDPKTKLPVKTKRVEGTLVAGDGDPVPELIALRWRMAGTGEAWKEVGPGGRFAFDCRAPGEYRLEFQARHTDGRWDGGVHEQRFDVPLPWWRRSGTLAVVVIAWAGAMAAALWWTSVRRWKRKLEKANMARALEQDRLRIARDMHDDIGARLTQLALLADRMRRAPDGAGELLGKLSGEARSTVGALDQIVWAVNPKNDTLGSFTDYLAHHTSEYLADAGLSCRLDLVPHERGVVVPFSVRHPLMMVVKEALQNVVKHAGATRVLVALRSSPEQIEIEIADDGKGLGDRGQQGFGEEGLGNMQARLAEIGGQCMIVSEPAEVGTRVVLTVPLSPVP